MLNLRFKSPPRFISFLGWKRLNEYPQTYQGADTGFQKVRLWVTEVLKHDTMRRVCERGCSTHETCSPLFIKFIVAPPHTKKKEEKRGGGAGSAPAGHSVLFEKTPPCPPPLRCAIHSLCSCTLGVAMADVVEASAILVLAQ